MTATTREIFRTLIAVTYPGATVGDLRRGALFAAEAQDAPYVTEGATPRQARSFLFEIADRASMLRVFEALLNEPDVNAPADPVAVRDY